MQNVQFQAMDKDAFRGLQTLRHLRLDDNSFMDVPTPSLAHVANLRDLRVGRNPFSALRDGSFRGLRALRSLGLSACPGLKTIESGAFRGCSDLEKVTITMNRKLRHIAGKKRLMGIRLENSLIDKAGNFYLVFSYNKLQNSERKSTQ